MSNHQLENTSFLFGANAAFIEQLYAQYQDQPQSVDPAWREFFAGLEESVSPTAAKPKASWTPKNGYAYADDFGILGLDGAAAKTAKKAKDAGASAEDIRIAVLDTVRAVMLIRAYRTRGHLLAHLDPLGLEKRGLHPELDPATHGFGEADWDRPIYIHNLLGVPSATLREILTILRRTYCETIGFEYMHIQEPDQKLWLQERIEGQNWRAALSNDDKKTTLDKLTHAEGFERFCHMKYTGTKRFGLEGGESLIPAMDAILETATRLGVREAVLGMAHRGRLNVLANIMTKPFTAIFSEFQGTPAHPEDVQGSGDVKYHLGTSADREFNGRKIHLSLTANPSHLEIVNPVVIGKVRAKQAQLNDTERAQVMSILLHGDAAFAGQGVVAECFALSELKGYRTGGTVHVIINNQIGFTTSPNYARSSPYPSDVAKMVGAPIFHVNGDDPEAVVHVARLATEFRQTFKKDVVIDLFCYRRQGHNETDEPAFTQPIMYKTIAAQATTRTKYAEALVSQGVLTAEEAEAMAARYTQQLEEAFVASKNYKPNKADWLEGRWAGLEAANKSNQQGNTAVDIDTLREIGRKICTAPEGFTMHRTLKRVLDARKATIEAGENLDWATGEALAFGSLAMEGFPIRLSGQDCGRGTFSQRHAVLTDQATEERFVPLNNLRPGQASFEVHDSLLSEEAVLGYEYGFSLAEPKALVCWEAQFGDFVNGAQVIIDQFIASAEAKWLRMSGLVMLLPHGYEGAGPEHSSARLERFLQLCAEDNMQVMNLTTPAQYFHALRRQLHRKFRKPLVIMTPKSLLRHKMAVSTLADMGPGSGFRPLLAETQKISDAKVRRVILCSGKVYYDLLEEREKRAIKDIAILRVEQLYPFPEAEIVAELSKYKNATEIVWVQEEHKNMGGWFLMSDLIEDALGRAKFKNPRPRYVGRAPAASTATGLLSTHLAQQKALLDEALA